MSYDELIVIMEHLKEDLTNFMGSLNTDMEIVNTRYKFKAVCEPKEIVQDYIEDLLEIVDDLKNNL